MAKNNFGLLSLAKMGWLDLLAGLICPIPSLLFCHRLLCHNADEQSRLQLYS